MNETTPRATAQKKIDLAKQRVQLAIKVQKDNAIRDAAAVEDARRALQIAGQELVDLVRDEDRRGLSPTTPAPADPATAPAPAPAPTD